MSREDFIKYYKENGAEATYNLLLLNGMEDLSLEDYKEIEAYLEENL